VRKGSIEIIVLLSQLRNLTIYKLLSPYLEILNETISPRKHLKLRHFSINSQIGILESLEFASNQQPQLFSLSTATNTDHLSIFQEITALCDADESQAAKTTANIRATQDFVQLRKAALRALSSFSNLIEQREVILSTFHRNLAHTNTEIQTTSFECIKKFIASSDSYLNTIKNEPALSATVNVDTVKPIMQIAADYLREYLHPLTDFKSLTTLVIQHLSYITQLYPTILNEKFSEYLLSHLKRWFDELVELIKISNQNNIRVSELKEYTSGIKICSSIIKLLSELQSAPSKLVETSIVLVLKYEKAFGLELSGEFRSPLSFFLKRYPFDTLKFLLHSDRIKDIYYYRFIIYLIKRQSSTFAQIFKSEPNRLIQMLNEANTLFNAGMNNSQNELLLRAAQIQFLTILIIYRLVKLDAKNEWIRNQHSLVEHLLKIWSNEHFHKRNSNLLTEMKSVVVHQQQDVGASAAQGSSSAADKPSTHSSVVLRFSSNYYYIKEPIYLMHIFISYLKEDSSNIDLLFKILIVNQFKPIEQYEFLGK
jgi:hypothetical protein